jgi:hypothetical protein
MSESAKISFDGFGFPVGKFICSVKENVYFSHKLGHQKWNAKTIIATSPTGETIKCSSQHDAAIKTGVSQTNVGKCANGKTDKVKGWAFRYG